MVFCMSLSIRKSEKMKYIEQNVYYSYTCCLYCTAIVCYVKISILIKSNGVFQSNGLDS